MHRVGFSRWCSVFGLDLIRRVVSYPYGFLYPSQNSTNGSFSKWWSKKSPKTKKKLKTFQTALKMGGLNEKSIGWIVWPLFSDENSQPKMDFFPFLSKPTLCVGLSNLTSEYVDQHKVGNVRLNLRPSHLNAKMSFFSRFWTTILIKTQICWISLLLWINKLYTRTSKLFFSVQFALQMQNIARDAFLKQNFQSFLCTLSIHCVLVFLETGHFA